MTGPVEQHIKRPMNAFMAWSKEERRRMVEKGSSLNNSAMSRVLGERWKGLGEEERSCWKSTAERLKREHAQMYPTYKYKPKRRISSGNSTTSTCPVPSSLHSPSSSSRSPPEQDEQEEEYEEEEDQERPDTPDSLGSLEGLDIIDMDDLDSNTSMQEIIEEVLNIGEELENIPEEVIRSLGQTGLAKAITNPKVVLPKLTQAMLAPKMKQGVLTVTQVNTAKTVPGVKMVKQTKAMTSTKAKTSVFQQEVSRPLILKKEQSKKELRIKEIEAMLKEEDKPTEILPDSQPTNPTVDKPRTFADLWRRQSSYIGDLERTFAAMEQLEERRRQGEGRQQEEKHLEFMKRLDTWGQVQVEHEEKDTWMEKELDLPEGWRDDELWQELDTRRRTEQVFVSAWLPKCALKVRKDPYRNLLRTINKRDPEFNMVW